MHIQTAIEEFCQYSEFIQGLSPFTINSYKNVVTTFLKRTGITHFDELDRKVLMDYFLDGRSNRGWRSGTFTTYYMYFRGFFSWCCDMKYLEENPVVGIKYPKPQPRIPKRLNKETAEKLLNVARDHTYSRTFLKERNHAIIATFLFTGLRRNELLKLDLSDVDLKNNTILVRHGKGGKERIVPIPLRLHKILKIYLDRRDKLERTHNAFFISSQRDCRFSGHGLMNLVKLLKEVSGISFTPHLLRHTFATLMLEGGCDIFTLSKMMGHGTLEMTKIYLEATTLHKQRAAIKHPLNMVVMAA